jgi:hypothetical protein
MRFPGVFQADTPFDRDRGKACAGGVSARERMRFHALGRVFLLPLLNVGRDAGFVAGQADIQDPDLVAKGVSVDSQR